MEKKFIITPSIQKNLDQMRAPRKMAARIETAGNIVKAAFLIGAVVLVARAIRAS